MAKGEFVFSGILRYKIARDSIQFLSVLASIVPRTRGHKIVAIVKSVLE